MRFKDYSFIPGFWTHFKPQVSSPCPEDGFTGGSPRATPRASASKTRRRRRTVHQPLGPSQELPKRDLTEALHTWYVTLSYPPLGLDIAVIYIPISLNSLPEASFESEPELSIVPRSYVFRSTEEVQLDVMTGA